MSYKDHANCRICNSDKLVKYLDLGQLPLPNNLFESEEDALNCNRYPLEVMFCENCGLSQLSVVVDPKEMFSHYTYRSSISKGYVDHCRQMAKDLKKRYKLDENSFVIDIAGNDGALLKEFREVIGCRVLNVDPAKNLYDICEGNGVRMFNTFWGKEAAEHIINTGWGKADVITATNVFAHVDDVKGFLQACKIVLADTGVIILEFPYLVDFIEKKEFDTVYFEHLSYIGIWPLLVLCDSVGLTVSNVEKQDIHGGTVRVTISKNEFKTSNPIGYVKYEMENNFLKKSKYIDWGFDVQFDIKDFKYQIDYLQDIGKKVAGFAASAKGNTLLNCSKVKLDYIVDQTPEKIGKYSPGTGIPIVDIETLKTNPPDYLVILSWNFFLEISEKCRKFGYTGKFIVPIPEFKIID